MGFKNSIFNKVISRVEYYLACNWLNIYATVYINIRSLPFLSAIRFPIYVYGQITISSLKGDIIIKSKISNGMIKLGRSNPRIFNPDAKTRISNAGKIIFEGKTVIASGCSINVSRKAVFQIGKFCYINENNTFYITTCLTIGEYSRFGYGSVIMDTASHYVLDIPSRKIRNREKAIRIGKKNWIGIGSTIFQGTITPDNTIISSRSLLNKDYTLYITENSMLAGIPAKLVKTNIKRVFNIDTENMLNHYFENQNDEEYTLDIKDDLEEFCGVWTF